MSKLNVEGKATIKNKFTFEVEHLDTGKVETYKAENIVLDQCFTRLVNFQAYFTHIHVGTGTGTLDPTRTSLFAPIASAAAKKLAETVLQEIALPTSRWQRRVVIDPEELVGEELTEVGIGYSATNTNLCTHALIEDSEGNPISLVKTDTMVVTIYADMFIELGELTGMYSGKWRWVQPLENNQLLSYLMGASYPTQYFRGSRCPSFDAPFDYGSVVGSLGNSDAITTANWTKHAEDKKVVTPVRRFGIETGNGEIRSFGLGSASNLGTFRGQFPIPGVFTSQAVDEQIGTGDGVETGFSLSWNDPGSLVIKSDTVVVDPANYTVGVAKKGTNLFAYKVPAVILGEVANPHFLTDHDGGTAVTLLNTIQVGIDVGADYGSVEVDTFRFSRSSNNASRQIFLYGSDNSDYSDAVQIATHGGSAAGTFDVAISPAVAYRYYYVTAHSASIVVRQVQILSSDNQIVFNTPPANGKIITAEYNVDYIPKDSDHVLDLQCAIQYGEGS